MLRAILACLLLLITIAALTWTIHSREMRGAAHSAEIHVLTYSAFLNAWGPGPEIAEYFYKKSGVRVIFQDAGDAGLILKKMALVPADVVIGLDQLTLQDARQSFRWKPLKKIGKEGKDSLALSVDLPESLSGAEFRAIDWAPLTFIYRKDEILPPKSLDDLLDVRFRQKISLEDPRTSTPGLQFYFWLIDEKGESSANEYLRLLHKNVMTVAGSWSQAYGVFTEKQASLVFSYQTSPVYHWEQEHNYQYAAAELAEPLPVQVEYAGVPADSRPESKAMEFVDFLLEPEVQKIIMRKNYMLPVLADVIRGGSFAKLPHVAVRPWHNLPALLERKIQLFENWVQLGY